MALTQLNKAIDLNSKLLILHIKGDILNESGDNEKALKCFEKL